jgi:aspartyl-tRNA(Asn)/glutamyl-tRNA(Gln) amidotransferase subunit A
MVGSTHLLRDAKGAHLTSCRCPLTPLRSAFSRSNVATAAWNGITGLKATIGRISTFGILPLCPTFDTPGLLTRDVEDAALLLSTLQGEDHRDKHTRGVHDIDPLFSIRNGVKGLRLGRLPSDDRVGIDLDILVAYDRAVESLAALGADIVDVTLPARLDDFGSRIVTVLAAESYAALSRLVDDDTLELGRRCKTSDGVSQGLSHCTH